jgi:excisionase family DNA binding protein
MINNVDPLLVPINVGAKLIGLGRSKIYELVFQKKLPLVKIGRRSLIPVPALREFADSLSKLAAEPQQSLKAQAKQKAPPHREGIASGPKA